jgi:hypothetical protein
MTKPPNLTTVEASGWRAAMEAVSQIESGELTDAEAADLVFQVKNDPRLRNRRVAVQELLSQATPPRRQKTTMQIDNKLTVDEQIRDAALKRVLSDPVKFGRMNRGLALQVAAIEIMRENPNVGAVYKNLSERREAAARSDFKSDEA